MITPDLTHLAWRKSTHSGTNTSCVEVAPWRTSSHSGSNSNCVEAVPVVAGTAVRDSKDRDGGVLVVSRTQWASFVRHVRAI